MKTKLIPWIIPEESTIYNPPLNAVIDGCKGKLCAYIKGTKFAIIAEKECWVDSVKVVIEVPDEPRRLTNIELGRLMQKGGFMLKSKSTKMVYFYCPDMSEENFNKPLADFWLISKTDKIEWVEPTTDLLEG